MKDVDISIIFVNYKNLKLLINSISPIVESGFKIIYEIVVDNENNDKNESVIKKEGVYGTRDRFYN